MNKLELKIYLIEKQKELKEKGFVPTIDMLIAELEQEINEEFAKEYPDSVQSNKGENNEFVPSLTD